MNSFKELKDILVIDIETVSGFQTYSELDPRFKELWDHKSTFINNLKTSEELYYEKGGIFAEFGKVVTISLGFFYVEDENLCFKVKTLSNNDEMTLLNEFNNLITTKFHPGKLTFCAHNGKEFDYPYLCRRMIINQITLPDVLKICSKKPWENRHVDTLEMWKFGDRKNFTSLDLLAATLGVPTSKDDCDGSMVNHIFYKENDLARISKYCAKDVVVTAQVYLRLTGKPLMREENIFILD